MPSFDKPLPPLFDENESALMKELLATMMPYPRRGRSNSLDDDDPFSISQKPKSNSLDISDERIAPMSILDHMRGASQPKTTLVLKVVPTGSVAPALLKGSQKPSTTSAASGQAAPVTLHSEYAPPSPVEAIQGEVTLEVLAADSTEAERMWQRRKFDPQPDALEILTALMSGANIASTALPSTATSTAQPATPAGGKDTAGTLSVASTRSMASTPSNSTAALSSKGKKLPSVTTSSSSNSLPPQSVPVLGGPKKTSRSSSISASDSEKVQHQQRRVCVQALVRLREVTALGQNDIHTLTRREEVLKAYLNTCFALSESPQVHTSKPALLQSISEGTSSLFVEFGGQGFNWLEELRYAYNTYPRVKPFVAVCAAAISSQVQTMEAQMLGFYSQGFDILNWISTLEAPSQNSGSGNAVPSFEYLCSAPISYPMVCLTQLTHCLVTMTHLELSPRELHSYIRACSGHSQGVVAAVVLASSVSLEHFSALATRAMLYMFWHGARVQQVFPPTILPAKILREASEKPTPMLSVRGLPLATLKKFLAQVSGTYVALINGEAPSNIVVSGHPVSLYRLQSLLATVQADSTQSQARIPFSKRKLEFSTSFFACLCSLPLSFARAGHPTYHGRHSATWH